MTTPQAVLIGAPGAGKSTVGPLLAELLGCDFTDIDAVVERRAGKPVAEIFIDDGEEAFRALEHEAVSAALREHAGVLALGGGAVMDPATQAELGGHTVVYLEVGFDDAVKRVGLNQARPLLAGNPRARLKALLAERSEVYGRLAAITVATSGFHPQEVAEEIHARITSAAVAERP